MTRNRTLCVALGLLALLAPLGCEDEEPVGVSDRITIQLSGIKHGDIHEGVVENEKNVTTESGNPYQAFLNAAQLELGRAPGLITVTSVSFILDGSTRGVAAFQDLFQDEVNVFLRSDAGITVYVGRVTDPTGVGPIQCEVVAEAADLEPILPSLLAAGFRVGIRGPTPRLETDDFDARVDVTIEFAAYP